MDQREWVEYFKAVNNRPPTENEIKQAEENVEFLFTMKEKRPKKWLHLIVVGLISIVVFFGVVRSLGLRWPYLNTSSSSVTYSKVIEDYQNRIYGVSAGNPNLFFLADSDVIEQIEEQANRQPSAAIADIDGNGKEELYIFFDDGLSNYEILAVYQDSFLGVKRLDLLDLNQASIEVVLQKVPEETIQVFDVEGFLTMNQEYLAEGDLSQIEGKWITDDGSHYSLEFDDEGITVLNVHMDNELYKNNNGTPLSFSEVQSGKFEGHFSIAQQELTFLFLPKGIDNESSDEFYDRIYFPKEDLCFYREDDIVYSGNGEPPMDFVDMLYGEFVNVSGAWRNGEGDEIYIYSDGTVDTKWANDQEITSLSIQAERMTGVFGDGIHGTAIHFIPRGVTGRGLENTDSDFDRVVIGDGPSSFNDSKVYYLERDEDY